MLVCMQWLFPIILLGDLFLLVLSTTSAIFKEYLIKLAITTYFNCGGVFHTMTLMFVLFVYHVASHFKYVKHRLDELDKDNFVCKYTMIEGDALGDKLESIAYEVKFEAASDGGCICKMISKYNTIGDFEIKEEEIKAGKDSAIGIYKVVEAYLLENPQVYA